MISVSRKNKPGKRIAYAPESGESAYFLDAGTLRDFGMDPRYMMSREAQVGKTCNGARWFPDLSSGRLTAFIAGNPGAGKSYLSRELIELLPPQVKILLFTALEEDDGNFEGLEASGRLFKAKMTLDNLKNISLSALRDREKQILLLFDDVDKIRDKKVQDAVFALMGDALANGRGHKKHDGEGDIHVITTSHALNDYLKTKYSLENSDFVGLFPQSTTYNQMVRMFDKLGLPKSLCDEIMALGRSGEFRSVLIHKVAPMFILYGDTLRLI